MPRSNEECQQLCMLREAYLTSRPCLNPYVIVSDRLLRNISWIYPEMSGIEASPLCTNATTLDYFLVRDAYRACDAKCLPDCRNHQYRMVTNTFLMNPNENLLDLSLTRNTTSLIMLPNQHEYTVVKHELQIDFYHLLGYLGGHAHIWLGLSTPLIYDIAANILYKLFAL